MNVSVASKSDLLEFPLWKSLVAVNVSLSAGFLVPATLFMNLSVFVSLISIDRSNKSLTVLSSSLLLGLCVDKVIAFIDYCVNSPVIIQYCVCMNTSLVLLSMPRVFFIVYSVVTITCQSVFQLLILRGGKQWKASFKRSFGSLFLAATVALIWTLVFSSANLVSDYPLHCQAFCTVPENSTSLDYVAIVVGAYGLFTLAPAFLITLVTSILALMLFKKKITLQNVSQDSDLNRKLLLLPLLMVFLLVSNNLLSYLLTDLTGLVLKGANLEPFFGNWANFISDIEYLIIDVVHGLSYPLILLYLHKTVRAAWTRMICVIVCRRGRIKT